MRHTGAQRSGASRWEGPSRSEGARPWWRRPGVVRPLVGAAVLVWVLWWYPLEAFTDAFGSVDGAAVTAALGLGLTTTVLCAVRWVLVARGVGLRLPWTRAVSDYYRAVFLNAVLPVGCSVTYTGR